MDKQTVETHFRGDYLRFYRQYLPEIRPAANGQSMALCPFHEDRDPSLSLRNDNGLFKCFGCDAAGSIFDFYARKNSLDARRDLNRIIAEIAQQFEITNGNGHHSHEARQQQTSQRVVARYDYTDQDGQVAYQIERMDPKSFRIRRPDGQGWAYNSRGVKIIPYRLPEVLKADEIIIAEGEKDADNLGSLGFTATTNPFGAGKWPDNFEPYFDGKHVVLIPHNDDPGRQHMHKVAAKLKGRAASIRWLELPDLPQKGGDASDFIAKFAGKEEAAERLSILIEGAAEYAEETPKSIFDAAILDSVEFRSLELPPRKIFLRPIIQEQNIALCSGARGLGKSWFGMSAADAVTRCRDFGPWQARECAPCLYLDGEMATVDTQGRDRMLNPHNERKAPLYIYSDAYANSLGLPRANLLDPSWRESMTKILTGKYVKVFFIDNLASLAGGIDENAKKDWDPVNAWIIDLRFKGITTFMQHHTNKEGGQRGTSGREDNIDLSILLKQPPNYRPENGADFIVSFTKTRLPLEDLKYAQDYRFTLQKDDCGDISWTWQTVKAETKTLVLRMLEEGVSQKDIAIALSISPARVSQIKIDAIKEKSMSKRAGDED